MPLLIGSHIPIGCPACTEPVQIPISQVGEEDNVLTVKIDLGAFRDHIKAAHGSTEAAG